MDVDTEQSAEELNEIENPFRSNALKIIQKMMELNHSSENKKKQLVDEILHSIFFLGNISSPPFSPKEILNDNVMLGALRHSYPLPFERYSSKLPRRSPFSCVLDMIVLEEGQQNEKEIKKKLQTIISELHLKKDEPLVSSTICVSQNTEKPNSEKHYGVSMSTSGRHHGRIMVAASCLPGSWDSYVAGAVMSFTPNKSKNSYFDGTFKMPKPVTCQAYSLHGGEAVVPPCNSCKNLFYEGHFERKDVKNAYGNCAEAESVSKLFKKDTEVRAQARPTSEKFTDENRRKAEESVREELRNLPKTFKSTSDYEFYNPNIGH